ncbi:MAG TPA: DUF2218 domain-containing protein [Stellaceae bacterium]|nr:DUF2218 domain-containing protein [Stellaceae bacterium]
MPSSEARVSTAMARRYLGQLCKHFAHRIPVTQTEAAGRIEFPTGTCELRADTDLLVMRAEAADDAALTRVQEVVDSHLARFAFRDQPEIRWVRAVTRAS